ncbi:MAG: ABC transporter permease [Acidobacteria bacterium]|nr:ABC transporter permease [Acidobacteriota bacterium]
MRLALRLVKKSPGFSAILITTLALAIGANSAIFSVVNGVLLKPLPYSEPERLAGVWHTAKVMGVSELNASPSAYLTYQEESRTFASIGLWSNGNASITGSGEPERVRALNISETVLPTLRIAPLHGRIFNASDTQPKAPETVILSYDYWQKRFGNDSSAVGRRLTVNGKPHEIVGILPGGFRFLDNEASVFLPLGFNRSELFVGNFSYQAIARLKPGVTFAQANADVARMIPLTSEKFPFPPGLSKEMFESVGMGPNVRPLKIDVIGDIGNSLWILLGAAVLVLLVACANVANLLLVRAESRHQEFAVRTAIGAAWSQIARQIVVESLTFGFIGGLFGLALAYAGIRYLVYLAPAGIPRLSEITIDPLVLLYTAGISLLASLLFGLVPVFRYVAKNIANTLRESGRSLSEGRRHHRARNILVVSQVALALVLLVSSGLMIRSFSTLRSVQPGFVQPEQVLTFRISIPEGEVPDDEQAVRIHHDILTGIQAIPGVTSASMVSSVTLDCNHNNDPIFFEDFPSPAGRLPDIRRFKHIAPGSFATLGNPIVAGRDFTWEDILNKRQFVLISENFAREHWANPADALGRRLRESPSSPWRQIIGVVRPEYDDGLHKKPPAIVYWPILLEKFWDIPIRAQRPLTYMVRSARTGTPSLLKEIQSAVWGVRSSLPIATVRTLDEIYRRSMMRTSFTLLLLAIASGISFILGIVGIYGVISYSASQRTREIGIRVALGARPSAVSGLFLRQGALLIACGIVLGLAASAAATSLLSNLLYGVKPVDAPTYAAVAAVLAASALLATWLPARRAAATNPSQALRGE